MENIDPNNYDTCFMFILVTSLLYYVSVLYALNPTSLNNVSV